MMESENFIRIDGRLIKKCKKSELDLITEILTDYLGKEPSEQDYKLFTGVHTANLENGYLVYIDNIKLGKILFTKDDKVIFIKI